MRYNRFVTIQQTSVPAASLVIREHNGQPFYEAKFRHGGHQVKRRIGPAWLTRDQSSDKWMPHRGRLANGYFDERRAHVRASELAAAYVTEAAEADRIEQERRARGVTFREVALAYLDWLEQVRGAKPATLRQHRSDLAEPDVPYKRGHGVTAGHIMRAIGDRPATKVTTAQIEELLATVAAAGAAPRTVNRTREVVCAAFNFGMKSSRFRLPQNPATDADRRRPPQAGVLRFYTPEEIEAVARALEAGLHRPEISACTEPERDDDRRDAEAVRVAAYAGLRLGELLALRWRDVDWNGSALTISRALSAGIEGDTKSGHVRRVPMADQAAAALDRLSRRQDFTAPDELVFCNALGRPLDGSALRRRYKRARDAAGLRPLRWHDLRHTFGSLLVAGGVDLVSVKDAMGHSQLTTTSRYLHARPATERAAAFTAAFAPIDGADRGRARSVRRTA
jgi:integrase